MRTRCYLLTFICLTIACAHRASASDQPDSGAADTIDAEVRPVDSDDEAEVFHDRLEIEGSVERVEEEEQGWNFLGDGRLVVTSADTRDRRGNTEESQAARIRLRGGASFNFRDRLRARVRIAGLCSTDECGVEPVDSLFPGDIDDSEITLDEAFVHYYRDHKFDVALGRVQTKFVTRGSVFAKSLDRADSNNDRIDWTDGMHATYRFRSNWVTHAILQYNDEDGPSNVRRAPLDFTDDGSRVTGFVSLENTDNSGLMVQRALDVSYLPNSLLKDGEVDGRLRDYWGVVARAAARWPVRSHGRRLWVSGEVGYAPETQTKRAANIEGTGVVDDVAWAVTASVVDVRPGHSIGINYASAGAGWLMSSQYRNNEDLIEVRYLWQTTERLRTEIRVRHRREIERLIGADRRRDGYDAFLRFTLTFGRAR